MGGAPRPLKCLFKRSREELSIWKLRRSPAGFRERVLVARGLRERLGELRGLGVIPAGSAKQASQEVWAG